MFLNAKVLGAEGLGLIALIILAITIIITINGFVGGSALVYLIPKHDLYKILFITYTWAVFSAIIVSIILYALQLLPQEFFLDIMLLSLIQSIVSINLNVLVAKEKIKIHNIISVLQIIFLFSALILQFFLYHHQTVKAYVVSIYIGYGASFMLSCFYTFKLTKSTNLLNLNKLIKEILQYGFYVQIANLAQLMNYRLSYYIVEAHYGKAALGVFDMAVKIAEGLWLPARSIALVQYSKISNTKDMNYSIKISVMFLKVIFIITLSLILAFLLIPESVFTMIKAEFYQIPMILLILSPGILLLSLNLATAHFFSGIGKHYYNTLASVVSLIATTALGFWLIPIYSTNGAAFVMSITYIAGFIVQIIIFVSITKLNFRNFLFEKQDFAIFKSFLKKSKP